MIPDLTHPPKAKQMFSDRKTLGGEKMRKSAILATVAVLALAGCSKKDPDSLAAAWEKAALSCKKTEGALKRFFSEQACSTRDEIERTLASAGYCYGDHGGTGQWDWKICTDQENQMMAEATAPASDAAASDPSRPPQISRAEAIAEASALDDCGVLFPVVMADQIKAGNIEDAEKTTEIYKVFYNLSIYTLIYGGFSDQEARHFIRERKSNAELFLTQPGYIESNTDYFVSLHKNCLETLNNKLKDSNRYPLLAYIRKNHDLTSDP